jgi:hypothetical protein
MAAASEDLNAQAERIKSFVSDLVAVVGGNEKMTATQACVCYD